MCLHTVSTTTVTGLKCTGSLYNELTLYTVPSAGSSSITVSSYLLSAPFVQLNWQASDLSQLSTSEASITAPPTSTPSTPASSTPASSTPAANTTTTGLTDGAKAGIGVGAALVVLGLVAFLWFFLRRRSSRTKQAEPVQPYEPIVPEPSEKHLAELHGKHTTELSGMQVYEAQNTASPLAWEMPGHNYNR